MLESTMLVVKLEEKEREGEDHYFSIDIHKECFLVK
jgi:hypothetical protein